MDNIKKFSIIENSDSIMGVFRIEDDEIIGFLYDKNTHIDSMGVLDVHDHYTIVKETANLVDMTTAYAEYIEFA